MAPPAGDHKAELLQSVVENSHRMIQRASEGHSDLVMAIHRHSRSMMADITEKSIELMSSVSENINAVLRDLTEALDCSPKVISDFENSIDITVQKLLDTRDSNLQNVSDDAASLILSVAENNSHWLQSLQSLNMCENSTEYTALVASAIDAVRGIVLPSLEGTVSVDVKDEPTDEGVEFNEGEQTDEGVEFNEGEQTDESVEFNEGEQTDVGVEFNEAVAEQADASGEDLVPAASKTEKPNSSSLKPDTKKTSKVNAKKGKLKSKAGLEKPNSSPLKTDTKRTSKVNANKGKLKSKAGLVIKRQKIGRSKGGKVLACPECGKVFGRSAHLKEHVLIHSKERNFICSVCGKTYKTPGILRKHLKIHSDVRHTCSVCNKKFVFATSLKTHMLYHKDERPNECEFCGKAYFLKQQLTEHKKVKHGIGDDKVFPCNVCGKEFLLKCRLRAHIKHVHAGKIFVQCEICGIKVSKNGLNGHVRLHGNDITCELCGKTFKRLSYYHIHKRIHSGDKPYKCSECDYASVDWSNLQKHTKTHRKKVVVELMEPDANTAEESPADSNLD